MNNAMPVIFSRIIIKSCFQRPADLIKSFITDSMHLNLKPCPISLLAKSDHFLIIIIKNTVPAVYVRFIQSSIMGAKASIQRTLKASANSR